MMRNVGSPLALAALVLLRFHTAAGGQSLLESLERELNRQVAEAAPSAVMVVALAPWEPSAEEGEARPPMAYPGGLRRSIGCGVVIDSLGHILTTSSVVEGARKVEVFTWKNRSIAASLLGVDPLTDLALLRAEEGVWRGARMGDSRRLAPGSWVTVLGNSFGAGLSVTTGVVSRRRLFHGMAGERLIQMDVPVNPGDTGGMVLNSRGELVGIICASLADPRARRTADEEAGPGENSAWEGTGIGFAIPISSALAVAERLRDGAWVERGFLGVEIRDPAAAYPGDERAPVSSGSPVSGVQVISVLRGSPAHGGGIRQGDLILEANGQLVESARHLSQMVVESPPGSTLRLLFQRGENLLRTEVTVGIRPPGLAGRSESAPEETE